MTEWWDALTAISASAEDFIWLTRILTEGIDVVPKDVTVETSHLANYPSALTNQSELLEYFDNEVRKGYMVKVPISAPPPCRIHPIALIPKSGQPGQWRLITDASSPKGSSINDICPPPPKFRLVSISDIFLRTPRNSWAGSVDIAHAFRNLPLGLNFIGHLAVRVGEFYYLELRLPFGWSWAPFIWSSFSDFVQRFVASFGFNLVVYIDDFLCLGDSKKECYDCMVFLLATLQLLGLPVKPLKTVWPTQEIVYLGFLFNFHDMVISVHQERLHKILLSINTCLMRKKVSRATFQKLVGRIVFISQVVRGARTFSRRLLDAVNKSPSSSSIAISVQVRLDLLWWSKFLVKWNGKEKIHPSSLRPTFAFASDASNIAAGGASLSAAYCHIWTKSQSNWHINIKELWSVYQGLLLWKPFLTGSNVAVAVDNSVVVSWLNSGTARSPQAMKILRKIFWLLTGCDAALRASWLSSSDNAAADAASRLDFRSLYQLTGIHFPWNTLNLTPNLLSVVTAPLFPVRPFFSHEFHQLLLRTKSVWLQSPRNSYLPDMRSPQNVHDKVRGTYLLGFALPSSGPLHRLQKPSSCTSLPGCSTLSTRLEPSSPTLPPYLRSMPPWELRSASRAWNVLRWPFYSEESAARLRTLLNQNSHSPLPYFSALGNTSKMVPTATVPFGLASWLDSGASSGPTISSPSPPPCSTPRTPSSREIFRLCKEERSLRSLALKRTNTVNERSSSPSLPSLVLAFVRSLPSKPCSNTYKQVLLALPSLTPPPHSLPIAASW